MFKIFPAITFFIVDIESAETTSVMPAMSGMAALGNSSDAKRLYTLGNTLIPFSLPLILVVIKLIYF